MMTMMTIPRGGMMIPVAMRRMEVGHRQLKRGKRRRAYALLLPLLL
jgi:hypothetical protein